MPSTTILDIPHQEQEHTKSKNRCARLFVGPAMALSGLSTAYGWVQRGVIRPRSRRACSAHAPVGPAPYASTVRDRLA